MFHERSSSFIEGYLLLSIKIICTKYYRAFNLLNYLRKCITQEMYILYEYIVHESEESPTFLNYSMSI